MSTGTLRVLLVLLCVGGLFGCEGEQGPVGPAGPAGPNLLLAYADIDVIDGGTFAALDIGPEGITFDGTRHADGFYGLHVHGSFPSTTGTLLVSLSTDQEINLGRTCAAMITGWNTTQITLDIRIFDADGTPVDDDFSFAILGE